MASTYMSDMPPIEPTEESMFAAPLYQRRKPKTDRTKTFILAGVGVLALAAVAGLLLMSSGDKEEIAAVPAAAPVTTLARAPVLPEPVVALPPQTVISEPVVNPAPPARPAATRITRVARVAPRRAAPAPAEVARSPETSAADVSATAPDVAAPPAAAPVLPPISVPSADPAL